MKIPYRVLVSVLVLAIPFVVLGVAVPIAPGLNSNQIWNGDNTFNGTVVFDAGVTFNGATTVTSSSANTGKFGVVDAGTINVTGNQLVLGTLVVDGGTQLNSTLGILGATTAVAINSSSTFTSSIASGSNGFACSTNGCRFDVGTGSTDFFSSDGTNIIFGNTLMYLTTNSGTYVSRASNGSKAFDTQTDGARIDVGTGSNDYFVSDATTISTPGAFAALSMKIGSGTTVTFDKIFTGTIDFANTAAGTCTTDTSITATGVAAGFACNNCIVPTAFEDGLTVNCWASGTDQLSVRVCNNNLVTAINPASGTYGAECRH